MIYITSFEIGIIFLFFFFGTAVSCKGRRNMHMTILENHSYFRSMLRAKPLTRYEISNAHVQPGQNAFDTAYIDHTAIEAEMKSKRGKQMKKWKSETDEELYDTRRVYLDRQRQHIVLNPDNQVLGLDNLTSTYNVVLEKQGKSSAKMFISEQRKYNENMKLHEKRFDFNNLQYTYLEARQEMMHQTYHHMDEGMKKVKTDWEGYHDKEQRLRDLMIELEEKKEEIREKDKTIEKMKIEHENLHKHLISVMSQDMKMLEHEIDMEQNKKRKKV